MDQVTIDTDGKQTPSMSHYTSEKGMFVFIIDKVDVQIENDAEDELSELRKQMKIQQDQMTKLTELMLAQVEQRPQAEKIEKIKIQPDSADVGDTVDLIKTQSDTKEESGIVYRGDKLEALESSELVKKSQVPREMCITIIKESNKVSKCSFCDNKLEIDKVKKKFPKVSGNNVTSVIKELEKHMFMYAKNLEFEKAAKIRDQISTIEENFLDMPKKNRRAGSKKNIKY